MKTTTTNTATRDQARKIAAIAKAAGTTLQHTTALDILAYTRGFASRNAMAATNKDRQTTTLGTLTQSVGIPHFTITETILDNQPFTLTAIGTKNDLWTTIQTTIQAGPGKKRSLSKALNHQPTISFWEIRSVAVTARDTGDETIVTLSDDLQTAIRSISGSHRHIDPSRHFTGSDSFTASQMQTATDAMSADLNMGAAIQRAYCIHHITVGQDKSDYSSTITGDTRLRNLYLSRSIRNQPLKDIENILAPEKNERFTFHFNSCGEGPFHHFIAAAPIDTTVENYFNESLNLGGYYGRGCNVLQSSSGCQYLGIEFVLETSEDPNETHSTTMHDVIRELTSMTRTYLPEGSRILTDVETLINSATSRNSIYLLIPFDALRCAYTPERWAAETPLFYGEETYHEPHTWAALVPTSPSPLIAGSTAAPGTITLSPFVSVIFVNASNFDEAEQAFEERLTPVGITPMFTYPTACAERIEHIYNRETA